MFNHPPTSSLSLNEVRRYMSLGIRGRPLATPDPGADHHVPVDDLVWEEGVCSQEPAYIWVKAC